MRIALFYIIMQYFLFFPVGCALNLFLKLGLYY